MGALIPSKPTRGTPGAWQVKAGRARLHQYAELAVCGCDSFEDSLYLLAQSGTVSNSGCIAKALCGELQLAARENPGLWGVWLLAQG